MNEERPLQWLLAADERGIKGTPFHGFGLLWMNWDRRGDFNAALQALAERHKRRAWRGWEYARRLKNPAYHQALVDFFFERNWLAFHCIIVTEDILERGMKRDNFAELVADRLNRVQKRETDKPQNFRLWVNPGVRGRQTSDQAITHLTEKICTLQPDLRDVLRVMPRESEDTPAIQLCDVLLGGTLEGWRNGQSGESATAVNRRLAEHLGWPDTRADTESWEIKFNVSRKGDPATFGEVPTRTVRRPGPKGLQI